jgi:hypothetical protein
MDDEEKKEGHVRHVACENKVDIGNQLSLQFSSKSEPSCPIKTQWI